MFMVLAFVAGVVRGYSGFGFAMMLTLGLLPSLAPKLVIPVVLLLDLVGSISLWPGALKTFHREVGIRLIVGMWLVLPLGGLALARLPEQWTAPVAAALCLVGGVLSLIKTGGRSPPKTLATQWALPAGAASGLATAMASAGGPPLIVYLLRSGLPALQVRGTAIGFFAISSASSLAVLAALKVLSPAHLELAATLVLPSLAGGVLGQWLFRRKPMSLQRVIGGLLVLMATATLASRLVLGPL
ncbi:sulfite exporter TauE/SafE family protein [Pseudomonas sp. XS1P51]